ncbi:MAG: FKBP-type peptidyl-prolyl cis-trans isomerase [Micrococcales bacterium]|nr:FKBP-type peptidyl-prolyl cis-trans isomerase [Micrococcales bacterium]MCL2668874.1 FKBP-type peptidyl-prolyl cis-trans isomerase [Micrococcales bacterium]
MSELPQVSGGFGDRPTLAFPATAAPAGLQVQVLVPGTGPVVAAGQTIEVNYLGQIWGGSVFDTSYDRGQTISFGIGVGQVIAGWDQGLVGQTIGSRVLLSIPSHLGYGDSGVPAAGIRGGDTLVFVVDIVNAR